MTKVAIIGYGWVGKAYHLMFPDAVIYDEPMNLCIDDGQVYKADTHVKVDARQLVNNCDIALICVPTNPTPSGELDMSIVEDVISWVDTPLILVKSALQPGTADRLIKETGKKIAVSVEYIGEGKYPIHFWKYPHQTDPRMNQMLIVGGEEETATKCAEILWSKMSPDISIHIVSALEAEITKLVENFYGSLKVTWINTLMSLTHKSGTNFIKVHQAWQADPRTDSMHLRTTSTSRGWKSKCWDKDVPALKAFADSVGADDLSKLVETVLELNKKHLNDSVD